MHTIFKAYSDISEGKDLCTQIHTLRAKTSKEQHEVVDEARKNTLV
jgi:hypothetical protein